MKRLQDMKKTKTHCKKYTKQIQKDQRYEKIVKPTCNALDAILDQDRDEFGNPVILIGDEPFGDL